MILRAAEDIAQKCDAKSILVIEPGVPASARLISLMRDSFLRKGLTPLSPCPHALSCPMEGKRGGKWCNFSFLTDDAPKKLLKLSELACLPKERAVLSYIFVSDVESTKAPNKETLSLRIASDLIKLPGENKGFYACSENGLVLAINKDRKSVV